MPEKKRNKFYKKGYLFCLFLLLLAPFNVFALESVRFAIRELCQHMEGNLGGLLMATAGVGGMISAAFGNMKAMYSFIITGIGAFTVSSMLSLYFPEASQICSGNGGGGGGAGNRTINQAAKVSNIDEVSATTKFLGTFKPNDNSSSQSFGNDEAFGVDENSDAELF